MCVERKTEPILWSTNRAVIISFHRLYASKVQGNWFGTSRPDVDPGEDCLPAFSVKVGRSVVAGCVV